MIKILTPKDNPKQKIDLFLAGGISDCPDWQKEIIDLIFESLLKNKDVVIANPRLSSGLEKTGFKAEQQIIWEWNALKNSKNISFWFPKETLCPITLFEYGKFLSDTSKNIFCGADKRYKRFFDLTVQTRLERPKVKIHTNLSDLAKEIINTF